MASLVTSLATGVSRFLRWWAAELVGLLPTGLRTAVRRGPLRLEVLLVDGQAVFRHGRNGKFRDLGALEFTGLEEPAQRRAVARIVKSVAVRAGEIVLRLPRAHALRRRVELPLAAGENLREVLGFEMDRHTPFQAGEVYFDYRLTGKDTAAKRLTIDLAVVARKLADEGVARLSSWGLPPDRLDVEADKAPADAGFNLLPQSAVKEGGRDLRRFTAALAAAACVLLGIVFYLPLQQKQGVLAAVESRLEGVRVEALEADGLSARVEQLLERSRFVVEQKQGRPSVAELMNEVTNLLPDHTWVIQFAWAGERLTVSGYSAKPSALIGLLEQSDMLSEVRFNSPVTADQRIGLERFNLSAEVTRRVGS